MGKQKVVLKLSMEDHSKRCKALLTMEDERKRLKALLTMGDERKRVKALQIVVGLPGVISAAVEGNDKDQIMVIGDSIDLMTLTRKLRKKMGHVDLVSVNEVEENKVDAAKLFRKLRIKKLGKMGHVDLVSVKALEKKKKVLKLKLTMKDDRKRVKALQIVVGLPGVTSVALEGNDRDEMVVMGDAIDPVTLTRKLRKEMGHVYLVSVNVIEEKTDDDEAKNDQLIAWPEYHCIQPPY